MPDPPGIWAPRSIPLTTELALRRDIVDSAGMLAGIETHTRRQLRERSRPDGVADRVTADQM